MPVPRVMQTITDEPRPAPNRYSDQAAAFASLSTISGRSMRSCRRSFSGSSRQARCGENRTIDWVLSTQPAAPMPTDSTPGCRDRSWVTRSTMASSTACGLCEGVGTCSRSVIAPRASTTPAATLVPPMSIPMLSGRSGRGWAVADRGAGRSSAAGPGVTFSPPPAA